MFKLKPVSLTIREYLIGNNWTMSGKRFSWSRNCVQIGNRLICFIRLKNEHMANYFVTNDNIFRFDGIKFHFLNFEDRIASDGFRLNNITVIFSMQGAFKPRIQIDQYERFVSSHSVRAYSQNPIKGVRLAMQDRLSFSVFSLKHCKSDSVNWRKTNCRYSDL